jgi:hypothetical protein
MDALRYGIMSLPETEKEIDTRLRVNMAGLFGVSTTSSAWDKPIKQNNQQGYIDEHLGLLD